LESSENASAGYQRLAMTSFALSQVSVAAKAAIHSIDVISAGEHCSRAALGKLIQAYLIGPEQ